MVVSKINFSGLNVYNQKCCISLSFVLLNLKMNIYYTQLVSFSIKCYIGSCWQPLENVLIGMSLGKNRRQETRL